VGAWSGGGLHHAEGALDDVHAIGVAQRLELGARHGPECVNVLLPQLEAGGDLLTSVGAAHGSCVVWVGSMPGLAPGEWRESVSFQSFVQLNSRQQSRMCQYLIA
jgi:hypothetical protein